MNARITLATASRILRQLRRDHRTLALMLVVPCVLLGLLAWMYADAPGEVFNRIGPALLGVFPFVVMFIVTSVATGFAVWVCGLAIAGPIWLLVVIALLDALLGTALGLLASGFARTEFQAVQFMPAFVLPQFLLCGLLLPRDQLPSVLGWVSDVLPLSYAVDAMKDVTVLADPLADVLPSLAVVTGWIALALVLGSLTLRRRTP